jgi:antitoxin component YwqK of YwqJK toxin-antitoxin module
MTNWDFLNTGTFKITAYYESGNKEWEEEYQNGQSHSKYILWHENGNKGWEYEYQNGQLHGKSFGWYENGNKCWEIEYQNGRLHGKYIGWCENGDKNWEYYYWKGKKVSEEEFNRSFNSPSCDGDIVGFKGKKYRLEEIG